MIVEIEIIMVDEANHRAKIIALENNLVIVWNNTLGRTEEWDLEDLKQCVRFI